MNSQGNEIAFRSLSALYKSETYLSDNTYRDFEVRPALQAILIPAEGSSFKESTNVPFNITQTDENGVSL